MPSPTATVPPLDALGPRGPFRAQRRLTVTDVTGAPAAELSLVPPLFVSRAMTALHRAATPPAAARAEMISRAAGLFATATLDGQSPGDYQHAVSRAGGVPISVVRAATVTTAERVGQAARSVERARPAGSVSGWRDPATGPGHGVWRRRGDVFAVLAAGNHPGTHSLWPEALALGYRVAVRPSTREPFTPHRLILALREAGFGDDQVALLPTGHEHTGALTDGADRSMVYGGDDVVGRYTGDPAVLRQGPGRSKVVLGTDVDWREHLDTIADSVSRHGGTGCVNATAVFVPGDPAPLCAALAERLAALPSLPPEDDRAVLPVQPAATAGAIAAHLRGRARGTRPWLGADGVADDLGDGSAVLRPALHQLDRPDAPQAGVELPFPCAWVAPWDPADGPGPVRGSLVVTAITGDDELVSQLLDAPDIGNVYVGDRPTYLMAPGLPHDGYLAEFLMRSKTVFRDTDFRHGNGPRP